MLGLMLLAMGTGAQAFPLSTSQTIEDGNFHVSGYFCTGAGCETTPRRLGKGLQFMGMKEGAFARVEHLKAKWNVRFDCVVSGNRIRDCRVVDQPDPSDYGVSVALKIIRMARVSAVGHNEPRAIVNVEFDPSGCPPWMCTAIPPPPPTSAK